MKKSSLRLAAWGNAEEEKKTDDFKRAGNATKRFTSHN